MAEIEPIAADFLLSIVFAALRSVRADSLLRPFPSECFESTDNTKERDHGRLLQELEQLGNADQLLGELYNRTLSPRMDRLARWFLEPVKFSIKPVPVNMVVSETKQGATRPTHAFELQPKEPYQDRFNTLKATYGSFIGFHGTAFENIYSILHNGLNNHLTKPTSLYGEGIYLSRDLSIALAFTRGSLSWPKSHLGTRPIAVVVGEIIDHEDVQTTTRHRVAQDSLGNRLPETYFVVRNNEHVRVKYVLVFAEKQPNSPGRSFLQRNVWWLLLFGYIAILFGLTFASSENRLAFVNWTKPFVRFFVRFFS